MCKIFIKASGEIDPVKMTPTLVDQITTQIRQISPDARVDVTFEQTRIPAP